MKKNDLYRVLAMAIGFLYGSTNAIASDEWDISDANSTCDQIYEASATVETLNRITPIFLASLKISPVTPVLKKQLKSLSSFDLKAFNEELKEVCDLSKAVQGSQSSAAFEFYKYVIPKITGPFGQYIAKEIEIGEQIVDAYRTVLAYQGLQIANTTPCEMNIYVYLKKPGTVYGANEFSDKEYANKIREISVLTSDSFENRQTLFFSNAGGKLYQYSGGGAGNCESTAGDKFDFIDILMDNQQRILVPLKHGKSVSVASLNIYFDLLLKDGKYSIIKR